MPSPSPETRLGLRRNAPQFALLVAVNALVGAMVGQEQTVLPLLARDVFGIVDYSLVLTYVAVFGVAKALSNWFAGTLSDRFGRKPVLIAGWLVAVPVPLMLMWAPDWWWIVLANALLGVSQGLTWSTTVVMKIDLVGPRQRGLAMGLNEAAGYGAIAVSSLLAGYLAADHGLRPAPFLLGVAYTALALVLSIVFVRETHGHARAEAAELAAAAVTESGAGVDTSPPSHRRIFFLASIGEPALSSASLAGLVNNLNFGLSWGLFPLLFATADLSVAEIAVLFALYPAVWGAGQLFTGALSDRIGRKHLVTGGMALQAVALVIIGAGDDIGAWATGAVLLGAGTALVYPTLLAVVGDVAHPSWRGRAVGVYRVWRDLGYAVGAVVGGVVADLLGLPASLWVAAGFSAAVAVVVAVRLYETHPPPRRGTERG